MNNVQIGASVGGTPLDGTHKSNQYGQMLARVWEIANSQKGALPTGFGVRKSVHPVIPIADGHTAKTTMEMTKAQARTCIEAAYELACKANIVSKEGAEHSLAGDSIPEILNITYKCTHKDVTTIVSLFGHCLKTEMMKLKSADDQRREAEAVANNQVTYIGKDNKGNDKEYSGIKKAINSIARWIHKTEFPTIAGPWHSHPGHKAQLQAMAQQRLVIKDKNAEAEAPAPVAAPVAETTTPTLMNFSAPAPVEAPVEAPAPVQQTSAVDKAVVAEYVAAGMSPADAVACARAEANL